MPDQTTIVFLGSPGFACPFLETLAADPRFLIQAVISQEDKPAGRKKILTPTPVKALAQQLNLPVFTPEKLNRDELLLEKIKKLKPDFLLVVAYGQILNQRVLNLPSIKSINVHGSILPKYRGASPIEQALLAGDRETGLSIMEMSLKMDTGAVYTVIRENIQPDDNNQTLRQRLSAKGAAEIGEILLKIKEGKLSAAPQDDSQASYCQKISKTDGLINPLEQTASAVYNRFRAFWGWPGIYLHHRSKSIKLLEIKTIDRTITPGQFEIIDNQIFLGCREGSIQILQLQPEGKNPQTAEVFLRGNLHLLQ
jgi:methionyl-tRNA formyltransferase